MPFTFFSLRNLILSFRTYRLRFIAFSIVVDIAMSTMLTISSFHLYQCDVDDGNCLNRIRTTRCYRDLIQDGKIHDVKLYTEYEMYDLNATQSSFQMVI